MAALPKSTLLVDAGRRQNRSGDNILQRRNIMRANSYGALEDAVDVRAAAWFDAAGRQQLGEVPGIQSAGLDLDRTLGTTPPKGE